MNPNSRRCYGDGGHHLHLRRRRRRGFFDAFLDDDDDEDDECSAGPLGGALESLNCAEVINDVASE